MTRYEAYIGFATSALQGMLANPECDYRSYTVDTIAQEVFDYADAMIKECDKRTGSDE